MAAVKTKRISTLIESQLPEFISTEYELFAKFVQKYYEAQEVQGGTLDIISNIQKYADIDYYEKNLLKQNDILSATISATDTTIAVNDASSFPAKNGYIRIGNEIIFYATRTDTEFQECSRGVSGNTTLGDLYSASNFQTTEAASHVSGEKVFNVSNLFLYALVKNFEKQYLGSFPEKYLRGEVDKRTLIKNINKFYKSKGTDSSIKFIFNTIVSQDVTNKPEVYKPKDFTYKASKSDWVNVYALKVKVISGDPKNLIGKKLVQEATDEYGYVSATVDNAKPEGTFDGEQIWNIILAPETITGEFAISTKTRLEKNLSQNDGIGKRINVFSTIGWDTTGSVLIGEEVIQFDDKNVTQFVISKRGDITYDHEEGDPVYKPVIISGSGVTLLTLGVVYNLEITDSQPYSFPEDVIQVSNPGFETSDPKIVRTGTNQLRWFINQNLPINAPTLPTVTSQLGQTSTDVSAIFADDQYYYITSSSYPSHKILDGSTITEEVKDQKLLRIIRKQAIRTTEKYKTPKTEIGILLNGVRLYGHRDQESIRFGKLEEVKVNTQGSGYAKPPFVLLDGVPNKVRAVLSGSVVERYIVDTNDTFPRTPVIDVTSGRGAIVRAVVTGDKVTSLVIEEPGEYYSSPPIVRITDRNGKGRFAEYTSIVDTNGKLIGFNKLAEGNFYNQNTVSVEIIAVGSGATATPFLKEWNFNRYEKLKSKLDPENGYVFRNYNNVLEYGYGQVANPKALRVALNDNLGQSGLEPSTKTHSPILGFAYDGNPIYGPFAHEDPLDDLSPIVRMTSSYSRNGSRSGGPSISRYPLGSFVNDYTYRHKSGSLDENNGRYCVTPDFPEGTYAYFLTIDSNQTPVYPYIVGENFYSLPVDSNYNSDINQNDIPKESKRLFAPGMPRNGEGVFAKIGEVKSGTIDSITIDRSSDNFSVNSKIYFDNRGSEGSEAEALVKSVKGKQVAYLDSYENKVVKLTTIQNAYLFTDDILRQPSSGASGQIVGQVRNDNEIVLKNVIGTFDNTGTFSADIKTFFLLLDQKSSYTQGAILSLTDGINPAIATAEVLNGTSQQNVVEIKVLSGDWLQFNQGEYFLQSNDFFNTSGTRAVTITSLSDNLEPFEVNQSVALVETTDNHGLGIGDKINISISPDDTIKTKTYYLRKRLYQKVIFKEPSYFSEIDDTGIGRFQILNGGADYAPGTYNNVPLTGGEGTGATASITVSSVGVVSNVTLQNKGTGYKKADYLYVDDESLERSVASQSTSRFAMYVDHVGFAAGSTKLNVKTSTGLVDGDLLLIGDEVIEVSSINGKELTVLRGVEGSANKDHYNGQPITLYKPRYNFEEGFQIGSNFTSGYISSYDYNTQEAIVVYDYQVQLSNAEDIKITTTFFDSSVPSRSVSVRTVDPIDYKFEFSEDNLTFVPNPTIDIQEFYRYKFDTSHYSLTGTYFDISPSKNYNIITQEKLASTILPGNTGAFTEVKFGFGLRTVGNTYGNRVGTDFTNFYYFDRNGIVNSEGNYLKIITDPLQGEKTVIYVTPNRFVYNILSEPLWDGSGDISYTTTGQFAVGKINDVKITNLGLNYKKVPIIIGVDPNPNFKATATVLFDEATKTITGIRTDNKGSNYSNPKVVIIDGDGVDAEFDIVVRDGEIFSITVKSPGVGYTYAPVINIIESDVEAYVDSNTIGIPQSINIIRNGGSFHLDKTVSSNFTSKYTVSLKAREQNFGEFLQGIFPKIGTFQKGETVVQRVGSTEVMRAKVSEWRQGSNLLKLESVSGIIRENLAIEGLISKSTGTVKAVYATTFKEKITSFFDNIGYYTSDRGRLGVSNQKLTDSFFYQDYSYVVKSKTPIDQWRELIKSTTHPAGFKLFGQVDIETNSGISMPEESPKSSHFSVIQLWDPEKNKITIENTRQTITQTVQKIENQRIRKGIGSASTSEFNFNESRAFTVTLAAPFDGYYDNQGRLQGTTSFQILNEGIPFIPVSAKNLIITLDGVLQEPESSYTVSGDTITFAEPPLGPYQKLTGNNLSELTDYPGVTFYGRYFRFRDPQYNTRYFKKLRNIFQRNGRWLDSANQIERNRTFIVEESIGYGRSKYPGLDWSTKKDDYEREIGYIVDAYEHDIRFGGNVKTVDYVSIFSQDTDYDYITKNKIESLDIFKYATNLAKLAIRNWDVVQQVSYIEGSKQVTVQDTNGLAVGMHISSGRAFTSDTKIVSIDGPYTVTLNKAALANSGGSGGAPSGNTSQEGTTDGDFTNETSTLVIEPGDTLSIEPGDTVTVPQSFSSSDSATFYMSGINSGTFYDAANIIEKNKQYITEVVVETVYAAYPAIRATTEQKCRRDIGYFIDAIVYHLRFGGNQRVVEYSRLYYTNAGYPYGEELSNLGSSTEIEATLYAWQSLGDVMITAMRDNEDIDGAEQNGVYFNAIQGVSIDQELPRCAEVASAITSMTEIMRDIIENGSGAVDPTPVNSNKAGYWTDTKTYSNYNIIPDPLLTSQECDDVVSSVDSLYDNVEDILNKNNVIRSLPDYVDGENKIFELYWEDGSKVNTEEDEDLFLTINAVLQRPKYNADYPGEDSYYIDRTTIPNKLVFDVAPIWDQDFGAKNIGEPTAVEKVVGIGVGNYKRLTIDYDLVDDVKSGPFLILDVEDLTVQSIDDKEYLYVFLDGVLQREGYSYTISGPNIYFNVPIKKEMKIDMRYLYGRDVGQILKIYDFSPDQYFTRSSSYLELSSYVTALQDILRLQSFDWMEDKRGYAVHVFQTNIDGTRNIIGEVISFNFNVGGIGQFSMELFGPKYEIDTSLPLTFAAKGFYDLNTSLLVDTVNTTFEVDDSGRSILIDNSKSWSGTFYGKSYRSPFVSLSNGDNIRVEGEDKFRKIKKIPVTTTSKEQRPHEPVSNSMFGSVDVERYNGTTRGEGLSVVAIIENGVVVDLEWNQRNWDPTTQPTAYQYFTPPVLHFIPLDGNGGGARANVLVSKGQVISVDLIDGGSGYTKAPKVEVARRYDILSDRDIGVSVLTVGKTLYVNSGDGLALSYSRIDPIILPAGVETISSIVLDSVSNRDIVITAEIQIIRIPGETLSLEKEIIKKDDPFEEEVQVSTVSEEPTLVTVQIQDIISNTTISTNKQITTTVQNLLPNDALSNINYYAVGAYLNVDLEPDDVIVYISDTSKFDTNGYLLIGDEIVRYPRKLIDRFIKVERGQKGTTAKFWEAGTFLRQIEDLVSVAFGGVAEIKSETTVIMPGATGKTNLVTVQIQDIISNSTISASKQVTSTVQNLLPNNDLSIVFGGVAEIISETNVIMPGATGETTVALFYEFGDNENSIVTLQDPEKNSELVRWLPGSGNYDRYVESIYVSSNIVRRSGVLTDVDTTLVQLRTGDIIIRNIEFGSDDIFVGDYEPINAGPNIGNLDNVSWDSGEAFVSGVSIEEYSLHYYALTLADFTDRKLSSYTISRDYVNLVNPSIQNPVQHVENGEPIGNSLNVHTTQFFPSSGYLYHSDGTDYGIIYYGSKTATSFKDCVVYRGNLAVAPNSDIIPYTGNENLLVTPVQPEPVLDLNFSGAKSLNNQVTNTNPITFSRNSIGTYIDENGIIQTASINEPRFTYDGNGNCLGLLVEESRTNSEPYSQGFTSGWSLGYAQTTTGQSDPMGGTDAILVKQTNGTSTRQFISSVTGLNFGSNAFTVSVFVKYVNYDYVIFTGADQDNGTTGNRIGYLLPKLRFQFSTETISFQETTWGSTQTLDYGFEKYPNGWYRLWMTRNISARTNRWGISVQSNYAVGISDLDFVTGDNSSSVLAFGFQVEQGSFPTSYIPTSGSTVTRQRDAVNILGTSFTALGFSATEGTIYVENEALAGLNGDGTALDSYVYNIGDSGNLGIYYNTKSGSEDTFVLGAEYGNAVTISTIQTIDRNKVSFAYNAPSSDYGAYIDDTEQTNVTTNAYQPSTYNQLNIAPFIGRPFNGTISRLIYWPSRVSNDQIKLITK